MKESRKSPAPPPRGTSLCPTAGDHLDSGDGWGWQRSALHRTLATQGCQGVVVVTLVIFVHWVQAWYFPAIRGSRE